MTEKVKLPKSVADSFRFFTHDVKLDEYGMMKVFVEGHEDHGIDGECVRGFAYQNPSIAMKALVNGYEVEQTPEDEVRAYFKTQILPMDEDNSCYAITKVLNILNIKIEGVNA